MIPDPFIALVAASLVAYGTAVALVFTIF